MTAACTSKQYPHDLSFTAVWGGEPISCVEAGHGLTDLRFYVSEIVLIDSAGREYPFRFLADGRWQQATVALVDLENGADSCLNGTSEMRSIVTGSAVTADVAAVRFTIGVPFGQNHANPLLAAPPLEAAAMHWHWRSGYKFLRAGVTGADDGYWIHLGSTGCQGTVQNITGCTSPNRVTVDIHDFSPQSDRIAVDLAVLLSGIDLSDGIRSDCSSSPAESACEGPFTALGLDLTNEESMQAQRVFRVLR